MKSFISLALIILFHTNALAKTTTHHLKARLLQGSTVKTIEDWMIPNYKPDPRTGFKDERYYFRTNIFLGGNKNLKGVYEDYKSENEDQLINRMEKSYGQPYDALAKLNAEVDITKQFHLGASTTIGEVATLHNPVFPELEFFIYHDYRAHVTYDFEFFDEKLLVSPSASIGRRRVVDRLITTGDLINETARPRFRDAPWNTVSEFSTETELKFKWFSLYNAVTSLPLVEESYSYAEYVTGVRSYNFLENSNAEFFTNFQLYGFVSPYNPGEYKTRETVVAGSNISLGEHVAVDVFTDGRWYPGSVIKVQFEHVDLSAYTRTHVYDLHGYERSRIWGGNLRFQI